MANLIPSYHLFNYDTMSMADKYSLHRAMLLFTTPLRHESLTNIGTQFSLREQFREFASINSYLLVTYVIDLLSTIVQNVDFANVRVYNKRLYQCSSDQFLSPEFIQDFLDWWNDDGPDSPSTTIWPFSVRIEKENRAYHAVLLVLQRTENYNLNMIYADSHGDQREKIFENIIFEALQNELFEQLTEINIIENNSCVLQNLEQGGNCVMWHLLFIVLLVQNLNTISSPALLFSALSEKADVNIVLFELYLFFYAISIESGFITKIVFQPTNYTMTDEETDERLGYDNDIKNLLKRNFRVENCSALRYNECKSNVHCVLCKGEEDCMNRGVVHFNDQGECEKPYDVFDVIKQLLTIRRRFVEHRKLPNSTIPNVDKVETHFSEHGMR